MKDEIKEMIPENVKFILDDINSNILWNYILNLQKHYNDNVNKYEELIEKYSNLQKENEGLEEVNKCIIDTNTLLIKQKDRLYNDLDILSDRVDNALDYIKSFEYYIPEDNKEELIKILKGE